MKSSLVFINLIIELILFNYCFICRMIRYKQVLQPVDPDDQKLKILTKFQENFESTNKVFDENNKNRTLALMKNVIKVRNCFGHFFH